VIAVSKSSDFKSGDNEPGEMQTGLVFLPGERLENAPLIASERCEQDA
jgi:hypothetical protein